MALVLTRKICDLLIAREIVSKEDMEKAKVVCTEQGGNLGSTLVKMSLVSRASLIGAVSEELNFPPMVLTHYKIDDDILKIIPEKLINSYKVLPIARMGQQLTVAMVDPLNIFALDDIKSVTRMDIIPVIVGEEDMAEAIVRCYEKSADEEINELVEDIQSANMEMVDEDAEELSSSDLLKITEEAPVVKLTNMILSRAIKERASDILVEPMEGNSRIRYRIDGVLFERFDPPKKFHSALISRMKVLSELDIAERRKPQDGRFSIKTEGRKVDFRVSIVPSSLGERAVLRILDKDQATLDLDRLGFHKAEIEKLRTAGMKPHGMVLVCGPTGCGKTTTLYSLLKHIDDPGSNIVTVEDPVEYELRGINQVSINPDIGLTFSGCLRSILRQDPDIIMVGEIRDFDTLDVAIKSALTGHLVLSTLHTNTAAGTIIRMTNMGVEPFLIASSVELIAVQRLIRKLCTECREAYKPSAEIAERYRLLGENGKIPTIFRPVGCKRCVDTGYKGRIGIIESMRMSEDVKTLIFKHANEADIEKVARAEGMKTLRENAIDNVVKGVASLEDVLCVTIDDR